jgi:beta-N-acetylhexosaminidase
MIGIGGIGLSARDRAQLCDPAVGGVVLFARNWRDSAQLRALCAEIHALRAPALLIAADQEGGRVQRFRDDAFTRLPSMRTLGELWVDDHDSALEMAQATGFVLAAELRAHGVDLSFAPVLDLDHGRSRAIGNRALHRDPQVVAALAQALLDGMRVAGMWGVGKHFPGHGHVEADSHHETPADTRDFATIWDDDLLPYRHPLLRMLAGVMAAHVVYPVADAVKSPRPAGFSSFWLGSVLRRRLGFDGVVFSDDLDMEGARSAGDIMARARAAATAGCDMLLICNRPDLVDELIACGAPEPDAARAARLAALVASASCPSWLADPSALESHAPYVQARTRVETLAEWEREDALSMTAATVGENKLESAPRLPHNPTG